MGFSWTDKQQEIIDHRQGDLLVAAGAGSGKTAVLTEHIQARTMDPVNPIDVDRMLVLTFTNAAAAEMKDRVRKSFAQQLEQDPFNERIRKQLALLETAQISTIHSFCLQVLRENFFRLDLDPAFRIADEGEMALLKADILTEILEEKYQEADPDFMNFAETYGTAKGDSGIVTMVMALHKVACSFPNPEGWIQDHMNHPSVDWLYYVVRPIQADLQGYTKNYARMVAYGKEQKFPEDCMAPLEQDLKQLQELCEKDVSDVENFIVALGNMKFASAKWKSRAKNPGPEWANPLIEDVVKPWREKLKKKIDGCMSSVKGSTTTDLLEEEKQMQAITDHLLALVEEFHRRFQAEKKKENQIDFNDMERFTWRLLLEADGQTPTELAQRYAEQFEEIMTDEYQDCNRIQEDILDAISRKDQPNRFMVGDVKQSIYGFRKARPEIFLEKYNCYGTEKGDEHRKIELRNNFRSSPGVLDAINALFDRMMVPGLGGVDYRKDGELEADVSRDAGQAPQLEICLLDMTEPKEKEPHFLDGKSREYAEALMVAQKIHAMKEAKTEVFNKEKKTMQPMTYGDVAVLVRSTRAVEEVYRQAFAQYRIPFYCESERGYFSALEVRETLQMLHVFDNPYQDIPLVGALHGGFFGFTAEELAQIRHVGIYRAKTPFFYDSLVAASTLEAISPLWADAGMTEAFQKKLCDFLAFVQVYRRKAAVYSIQELLTELWNDTGYLFYTGALPNGKKRLQNLRMLLFTAENFETTRYRGIFQFLRYVEQLEKYEVDVETPSLGGVVNAVCLTTIHKSKGLEFPVCIISHMSRQFNETDQREKLQQADDIGVAMDVVNTEFHYFTKSNKRKCIIAHKKRKLREEEMRVLYVGMTRARDYLILTGRVKDTESLGKLVQDISAQDDTLDSTYLMDGKCYMDWVLGAVAQMDLEESGSGEFRLLHEPSVTLAAGRGTILAERVSLYALQNPETEQPDREVYETKTKPLAKDLLHILERSYPYEEEKGIKAIYAVSYFKQAAHEQDQELPPYLVNVSDVALPEDVQQRAVTGKLVGPERGDAYHHAMEGFDFAPFVDLEIDKMDEEVDRQMQHMVETAVLTKEEAASIDIKDIVTFFGSTIGQRMCRAAVRGELYKEQEFVQGWRPDDIRELSQNPDTDEAVLVQGIIDAVFREEDHWIIVDYKTDRVKNYGGTEELLKRYHAQLRYYKRAWEAISQEPVTETMMYSFDMKCTVEV